MVNINSLIIGLDWVSKFTLSLLRALKSLYTSKCLLALNWIHCLNRSNGIQYWCYSNRIGIYMFVNLHGQSNQRKGDIFYTLNIWGRIHLEMRWIPYKISDLHITCKSEKNLTFEVDFYLEMRWILRKIFMCIPFRNFNEA